MKRLAIILACSVLIAGVASAQVKFSGGPHAGIAIASFEKSVKDYYGLGFQFGAQGEVSLLKFLSLRGSFDYNLFPLDKNKVVEEVARDNGVATSTLQMEGLTVSIMSINVSGVGKIPTAGPVTPYGIVGFGLNILNQSDPKLTYNGTDVTNQLFAKPESKTKFGLHFGAGSEFGLGGVTLFVEAKYVIVFTENESNGFIPITVGVNF
jgi:opacity protein-like surface antigen